METCPRCGSFAVLVDTGFIRVCAACVPLSRHPAQLANGDPIKLLSALAQTLREVGWLAVAAALVTGAPALALKLGGIGAGFVWGVYSLVAMSFCEALVFLTWRERVLQQRRGAPLPWKLAFLRLGPAIWANVVGSIALTICFPAAVLYGCFMAGIGIAVLEGRGPVDSFVQAWRRSAGQRVGLSVGYVVTTVPPIALFLLGFGAAVFAATRSSGSFELQKALVPSLLLLSLAIIPANLFQAVAWLATLPIDEPTTPPPAPEPSLTQAPPPG